MSDRAIYEDRVLKLADLITRNTNRIENATFINCQLYGPAVMFADPTSTLNNPTFDTPSMDQIVWPIPPDEPKIGGINAVNCVFEACRFSMIGMAVTPEQAEQLLSQAA